MKNYTLYGLRKPGEEVRYIGITGGPLEKRLRDHMRPRKSPHKDNWIKKLKREGCKLEIIPYCVGLTEQEACNMETSVIETLRLANVSLVNTSAGGRRGPDCTGKKHSEDAKKKIGAANRISMLGNKNCLGKQNGLGSKHPQSEATIEKIRAAHSTPEARKRTSIAATGRKRSVETRERMALSKLGNKHGLGSKHPHSDATKEKLSAKASLQWEKKRQEEILEEMWR